MVNYPFQHFNIFLSYSHKKEKPFVTSEYEVFCYNAILVASQVSNDATKTLLKLLPTFKDLDNSRKFEDLNQQ